MLNENKFGGDDVLSFFLIYKIMKEKLFFKEDDRYKKNRTSSHYDTNEMLHTKKENNIVKKLRARFDKVRRDKNIC